MKRKILWAVAVIACLTCAFALIGCTGGATNDGGNGDTGSATDGGGNGGTQAEPVEGKYFYWEDGEATTKFIELKSGGEAVMERVFNGAYGSIFYGTYTLSGENIAMTFTRGNLGEFPVGESNTFAGTVKDGVMRLYADYDGDPTTNDGVFAYFAKEGKTPPIEQNPGENPSDESPVGKYYACQNGALDLTYYIELKDDFTLAVVYGEQNVSGSYRLDGDRVTLIQDSDGATYVTTLRDGSLTVEGITFYKQNATPPYVNEAGFYYLSENGVQNQNKYIELGEYGYASMETVFDAGEIMAVKPGTFVLSDGSISITFKVTLGQSLTISGTLSDGTIVLDLNGIEARFVKDGTEPLVEPAVGTYWFYDNGVYDHNAYVEIKADGALAFADGDGGVYPGSYTLNGRELRFTVDYGNETRDFDGTLSNGVLSFNDRGSTVYLCKEGKVPPVSGGDTPGDDNPPTEVDPPVEVDPNAVPGRYYWWNEGAPEYRVYFELKDDMTFEAHSNADVMSGIYSLDGINITMIVYENGAPAENSFCPPGTVSGGILNFDQHGGFTYCKEGIAPPTV